MTIQRSTIQLLRLPFSFFLMPVYWFALGQVVEKDWGRTLLVFFILHVLVYPASNGYNSYMDRDDTPIGGLEHPPAPSPQLYRLTVCMDLLAIGCSFFISLYFVAGISLYILASRAYSYRGIRLKKYPFLGYVTVITCQGALVFFLVYHGCHTPGHPYNGSDPSLQAPFEGMLASSLLIGSFYPLTQLYQHEADRKDGVKTISMVLGYRGSFLFSGALYAMSVLVLAHYFIFSALEIKEFFILATCLLPASVYFLIWAMKVWKDPSQANFNNTMRMNLLGSICANAGFIAVLVTGS